MPGSLSNDINLFAANWLPLATMVFMLAMVGLMTVVMRSLPRTKPQELKPDSASSIGWDQVAGVEDARSELEEVVEFLRDPERFARLGARVPRGVLLHGPPGTGKTMLAKAVANESGARFYAQSAAGFVEMFSGLGAARVRRLFRMARKHEPAIIFIDELDAVGGHRGVGINGEKDQTLNQLLIEMDGFRTSDRLVVIAASNLLDKLDSALLRPGRFDRQIYVAPPDVHAREAILRVHIRQQAGRRGRPRDRRAPDLGSDRRRPARTSATRPRSAPRAGGPSRSRSEDFDHALERVIAGTQSRRALNDHEKRVVAYHEAGHALVRGAPAGGRPRAPDLDRPARACAGLHAQPPRRGPLPQDARGARRLHDDAARRARGRAARRSARSPPAPSTTCGARPRSRAR